MRKEEVCEKIFGGLPSEIYDKIEIIDNTNLNKITENLNRYELAKIFRKKKEKPNIEIEKLNNEVDILKKHIQQLNLEMRNKPTQTNLMERIDI